MFYDLMLQDVGDDEKALESLQAIFDAGLN
jgi:hypothetical protein